VFVNFWASQLFAPSVIDDIPLSIRIVITLRLLPLPLPGINVKVVKLKPVQPVKNISCVSYCTRSKSHWVRTTVGKNQPLFVIMNLPSMMDDYRYTEKTSQTSKQLHSPLNYSEHLHSNTLKYIFLSSPHHYD
jgi:hypothetical protein